MALVTKSFSDIITFTRASTGTFFNSAGVLTSAAINAPRFDYNPATLAAQGLLIEEQRTNLRTYSDAITLANAYGTVNTTISTVSTATPISGVTTATLSVLNVGAGTGNTSDGLTFGGVVVSNTTQYTQSIFVKPAGATVLRLRNNALGGTADFILTGNGTAPGLVSGIQAATIAPVGNGWYRCTWTFTTGTTAPGNRMDYWALKSDVADGVNGLYFTGAQFEAGAFPTSYIPTTTTTLTRSADVASVNTLSPWFNATAGTLYAEYIATNSAQNNSAASLSDNTNDNRMLIRAINSSAQTVFIGVAATVTQWNDVIFSALLNTPTKSALAYATNDIAWVRNGGAVGTDTSATIPTVNRLQLGLDGAGTLPLNGYLRRLTYYPRRLSNAELQAITA